MESLRALPARCRLVCIRTGCFFMPGGGIAVELKFKAKIMDEAAIDRTLVRIAHEILEKNDGTDDLCLIGTRTRGVPLARRLAKTLRRSTACSCRSASWTSRSTAMICPRSRTRRYSTGRTFLPHCGQDRRAGRRCDLHLPHRARSARRRDAARPSGAHPALFLIDRGHSELPIKANYVGKNIPTSKSEAVAVRLQETDGENSVCILERG